MGILYELLNLKGKELEVFEIDYIVDEIRDYPFTATKFTKEHRVFEFMDYYIEVKYEFDKEDSIRMKDKVKITDVIAMY